MNKRGSGILLHITCLPSPCGIGDLGPWAYKFADFLAQTKQSFWQVLPLNPTESAQGNSPYSSMSTLAANPLLISPEFLLQHGLLTAHEVGSPPNLPNEHVDYHSVSAYKERLFHLAHKRFSKKKTNYAYESFCCENSHWLNDFALFAALKAHFKGKVWNYWPVEIRHKTPEALQTATKNLAGAIDKQKFLQYIFFKQWFSLKTYCNQKGIQIIGDIPIYVNYDSVEVWSNPDIFKLTDQKKPAFVAGVPPDYFSKTGQLWGNPVYHWDVLKQTGYAWWIQRMQHNLKLFNIVRIDHFRGLVAYWEVPAAEKTAVNGQWVQATAKDLLKTLFKRFSSLPIIAEDLGLIDADVREVMYQFGIPGMKVLLFAFGEDHPMHPYLPHTYEKNCIVYTGTHDNNTSRGWFAKEATPEDKKRLFRYIGKEVTDDVHWEIIRLAMQSVANMVIIPLQDILGLGEEARMNRPATAKGNWQWRLLAEQLTPLTADRLLEMTETYGRDSK